LKNRSAKKAKKNAAEKTAKKTASSEKQAEEFYFPSYSYYYYFDDAEAFLNNRPGAMKNMWFTVPTTPTIAPSVVPTIMPSEVPSEHPSEMPTIMPSIAPSEVPTIAPSMAPNPPTWKPTPAGGQPTASPSHQLTYTFSVTQVLDGITAAVFNNDVNNTIAFTEAVAMAVPPLTSDNINIYDVVNDGQRRLRGLSGSAVDISYSITYTVAETGYNDATTAFNALNSSLYTAIVSTDLFNGYIQVAAATNNFNAPELLSTTSNSYTATTPSEISTDDDNHPMVHNHNKVIVGVLVGLGGGLLVIAVIAFCIFGRGDDESQGYSNPQSVTVNDNRAVEMTSVDPTTGKSQI